MPPIVRFLDDDPSGENENEDEDVSSEEDDVVTDSIDEEDTEDDSDDDFQFIGSTPATNNSSRAPSPRDPSPRNTPPEDAHLRARVNVYLGSRPAARPAGADVAPPVPFRWPGEPAFALRPPTGRLHQARSNAPGSSVHNAIALGSSDEEEPPAAQAAAGPSGGRRVMSPNEFRNHMDALDRSLDRASRFERRTRRQAELARRMAENPPARHDRDVRAAAPEAGPAEAHNRLGGAAIRRGNAQYIFRPNQPPEVRYPERDGGRPRGDEEGALPLPPGLDRLFGGMRRNPAIIRNLLTGAFYLGGAGPALQLDAKAILETVKAETPAASADGFTHTWDPEDLAKEVEEKEKRAVVVELDERGRIVPDKRKQRGQVYLACCACPEPLRVGSANRSPDDRVWALRCGHVLDQRCYKLFSEPAGAPPIPVLDAPPAKRRRSGRTTRARAGKVQHQWACPVKGCGFTHVSEMVDDVWAPLEGLGGMQLYV